MVRNIYVTLIEGIDGSGKTTVVRDAIPGAGLDLPKDSKILKLTQKFPTKYPQDWDAVGADFFLDQMSENNLGLDQITEEMIQEHDYIHLFLDRAFITTAVYQQDYNIIATGIDIFDQACSNLKQRLRNNFQITINVVLLKTDVEECAQRVLDRKTSDETQDPMDTKSHEELVKELTHLNERFLIALHTWETIVKERPVGVKECHLCGQDHYVAVYPYEYKISIKDAPTHWYMCPVTNSPMYCWVEDEALG